MNAEYDKLLARYKEREAEIERLREALMETDANFASAEELIRQLRRRLAEHININK